MILVTAKTHGLGSSLTEEPEKNQPSYYILKLLLKSNLPNTAYISRELLKLEKSDLVRRNKMPINVTINRSNGNRRYNSNMADVLFLKLDVVY